MLEGLRTLRCGHCGAHKDASSFPPSQRKNGAWCRQCYREEARARLGAVEREIVCGHCGARFHSAFRKAQFCSRKCKDDAQSRARQAVIDAAKPERLCVHCGAEMPRTMRVNARFCSEICNSAAHRLKRGQGRLGPGRRREIERAYIIKRDRSRCHLCGKKCRADEIHLDHLVPLALGGSHDESNLRVACARCNTSKGARPANDQLMLVG